MFKYHWIIILFKKVSILNYIVLLSALVFMYILLWNRKKNSYFKPQTFILFFLAHWCIFLMLPLILGTRIAFLILFILSNLITSYALQHVCCGTIFHDVNYDMYYKRYKKDIYEIIDIIQYCIQFIFFWIACHIRWYFQWPWTTSWFFIFIDIGFIIFLVYVTIYVFFTVYFVYEHKLQFEDIKIWKFKITRNNFYLIWLLIIILLNTCSVVHSTLIVYYFKIY